ncbi:MAG: hypothetical protein MJ188_05095 [Treponema sp.]|nr:hypothetical protein [Treponema sp.]
MLKRKLTLVAAVLAASMMFSSCIINAGGESGSGSGSGSSSGIDYTNYTKAGEYSVKVRNESMKDVVIFANTPSEATLLSGARAGVTTGLKLNKDFFEKSQDFVLFAVTEEDYLANKNSLKKLEKSPFAMVYAYYNADSDSNSNNIYSISASMGGTYYILLNNGTEKNVELRNKGLYGESIAFAGAGTVQTKVYLQDDDYYIYPVFRKFQKKTGEIVSVFPKETVKGEEKPLFFQFSLAENGDHSQEFNVEEWYDKDAFKDYSTPSAAYIMIHNGNKRSGITLKKGANAEASVTSTGGKNINTGKDLVFEVPMGSTSSTTFSSTANIEGWYIATAVGKEEIPSMTLQAGYMYYLDVTGDTAYDMPSKWRTLNGEIVKDEVNFDEE